VTDPTSPRPPGAANRPIPTTLEPAMTTRTSAPATGTSTTTDLRVARTFKFGGAKRLQVFMEVFNVPNYSTVLTVNETVGPNWLQPQIIDQPRHFQFGAQFDF